jgi:hypothetical protein
VPFVSVIVLFIMVLARWYHRPSKKLFEGKKDWVQEVYDRGTCVIVKMLYYAIRKMFHIICALSVLGLQE